MGFSRSASSFFYLFTSALLLQTVFGDNSVLEHKCSGNIFRPGRAYQRSLDALLDYFMRETADDQGFALGSLGQNILDRPYGLAQCRGDVSSSDCISCIDAATSRIRSFCPKNKGAIIWYENCLVKYSDRDFFGKIDDQNEFNLRNVKDFEPSSDVPLWNQKISDLMYLLNIEAELSSKLYAAGQMQFNEATTLYGLVQCTRDLDGATCKKCLDGVLDQLKDCCLGRTGARVISGSCGVRYETYPIAHSYDEEQDLMGLNVSY